MVSQVGGYVWVEKREENPRQVHCYYLRAIGRYWFKEGMKFSEERACEYEITQIIIKNKNEKADITRK